MQFLLSLNSHYLAVSCLNLLQFSFWKKQDMQNITVTDLGMKWPNGGCSSTMIVAFAEIADMCLFLRLVTIKISYSMHTLSWQ